MMKMFDLKELVDVIETQLNDEVDEILYGKTIGVAKSLDSLPNKIIEQLWIYVSEEWGIPYYETARITFEWDEDDSSDLSQAQLKEMFLSEGRDY